MFGAFCDVACDFRPAVFWIVSGVFSDGFKRARFSFCRTPTRER